MQHLRLYPVDVGHRSNYINYLPLFSLLLPLLFRFYSILDLYINLNCESHRFNDEFAKEMNV
jgi:hypothetical protein